MLMVFLYIFTFNILRNNKLYDLQKLFLYFRMSLLRPKLYVESLAEVAPNIFGPNVAAEKAATRRNRPPLRFNEHTYFQKFGWANKPINTGAIVPEGVERQPGHAWYNVLQPNKKSKTIRFPFGDPRRSEEAVEAMVNPYYRSNAAAGLAAAQAGTLVNTPYGLRLSNLTAKLSKRALGRNIVRTSKSPYAAPENLEAAIERRRVQGVTNLEAARLAAVALAEAEAADRAAAAPGGASARKRRSRRNRRRTTRRRR